MGYGSVDLTTQDLSYTITDLTPGVPYTVYVSAINRHGQGARAELDSGVVTPPLSVPSAPTNVTVRTKGYNETEGDGVGDSQVNTHTRVNTIFWPSQIFRWLHSGTIAQLLAYLMTASRFEYHPQTNHRIDRRFAIQSC